MATTLNDASVSISALDGPLDGMVGGNQFFVILCMRSTSFSFLYLSNAHLEPAVFHSVIATNYLKFHSLQLPLHPRQTNLHSPDVLSFMSLTRSARPITPSELPETIATVLHTTPMLLYQFTTYRIFRVVAKVFQVQ